MNVLAFILALVGAVLNLFMPFISIPSIIDVNVASIYSMIFSTWDKLKDSPLNGVTLLIIIILLAPINAFFASFDVLFRKKQTFFFKRFQYSPSVSFIWFAIISCIVALALGAISEALVQDFLKQAPSYLRSAARREMSEYVKYYVPLIWAACYGLAAMFTRVDEQNQKAHQEQLDKMNEILAGQKSQPTVSPENPQVTENIAKPETTNTEKTYEPVLGVETEALIKRANIFLEDEDFDEADRYFEQALNQDPENSKAYIGKLLVAKKVHNIDELLIPINLTDEKLFQRALKFADGEEKNRLEGYVQAINAKAEEFERIEREKAELARAEEAEREQQRKEALYNEAISLKEKAKTSEDLRHVIDLLKELGDYKDAPDMNRAAQKEFDEVQEKTEKSKTKAGIISVVALVLIVGGILYYSGVFSNEGQRSRVSSNSTSSTTTPSAQSVERTSNTENQPVKTKSEEASEYYSAGEEAYKEKNYQKAFENFTKAAELGNEEAQLYLARMYHEGEGVEKNLERTLYWMNKAYTTNPNYKNKFMLGIALCEGEDYKRAFPLLKEVAEIQEKDEIGSTYTLEVVLGNLSPQMITHAQMLVGSMYADGNGVERDYNQAEYWLKKSIEGGNTEAQELLDKLQSKMRSQTMTQPNNIERNIPDMSQELDELAMEFVKRENIPSSIVANGEIFVLRSYTSQFKAIDGDTAYIFSAPDTNSQAIFKLENGAKLIADAEYKTKDYGADWYYVHFGNRAKGWVLSQYIVDREPDDTSSSTNNTGRQVKVNGEIVIKTKSGGNVNVRSEPSTNSEIVGKAESGMRCSITRRATDEKGYTWYFVEEDYSLGVYGWVRGDLCKVVRISDE